MQAVSAGSEIVHTAFTQPITLALYMEMLPDLTQVQSACSRYCQDSTPIVLYRRSESAAVFRAKSLSFPSHPLLIKVCPALSCHHNFAPVSPSDSDSSVLRIEACFTQTFYQRDYAFIVQEDSGTVLQEEIDRPLNGTYTEDEVRGFLGRMARALLHIQSANSPCEHVCPFSVHRSSGTVKLSHFCTMGWGEAARNQGLSGWRRCYPDVRVQGLQLPLWDNSVISLALTVLQMHFHAFPHCLENISPSLAISYLPYSPSLKSLLADMFQPLPFPVLLQRLSEPTVSYLPMSVFLQAAFRSPQTMSIISNSVSCAQCDEGRVKLLFPRCTHGVCSDECRRKLRLRGRGSCPHCGENLNGFYDEQLQSCLSCRCALV